MTAGLARIWRSSLRLRLTVTGTLLAAVIFAIAGPVAITLYHRSLNNAVWGGVTGAARQVASKLTSAAAAPDPIPMPVSSGVPRIQVVDAGGHVVTGDPASASRPSLYRLPPGVNSQRVILTRPAFLTAAHVAVYAVRAPTPHGRVTVVAALSLDPAAAQTRQVSVFTAELATAALAVVAVVCWLTAGRALRPVERMRAQAAAIAASGQLSARLTGLGADELASLGGTLNQMLDALDTSVHRQRRLVADAAHELRTPLAGMITALEVAQTHPHAGREMTGELLAGHRRLAGLVNDLLILAAVEDGAPQRAEPVDLAGVVTDAARRPVPDGISLRLDHLDRLSVLGDETQLVRVVGNLTDNALRYATSTVELAVHRDGQHAEISVSDDGPGIPPADRERIWERFVRLDDDRSRSSGGSGLGLAMVKELTAAHGGTVSAISRHPAPGATFLVRLPVSSLPQPEDASPVRPRPTVQNEEDTSRSLSAADAG
jgi:two-component system, OmpR family, sensor kinase